MEEVFGGSLLLDVDNITENGLENYDTLKAAVLEDVAVYKGLVIQEENLDEASKWRADLNKKAKQISDFRIAFEKDFKKKIEKSVGQLKELTTIYQDASTNIDSQVKAFDEKRKAEKAQQIESIYESLIGEFNKLLPFEKVESLCGAKWMNKTVSLDSIKKEMEDVIDKAVDGIETIRGMATKHESQMIYAFLTRLDMGDALKKKTELDRFEEELARQRQAEEESRIRAQEAEERRRAEQKAIEAETATVKADEESEEVVVQTQEPIYFLKFLVRGTKQQLQTIVDFIRQSGVQHERL